MKGIILAGGTGSRLFPSTTVISKQLIPVYDKPMIYYPLATLLNGGITEILIITNPTTKHLFQELLGDGSQLGINIAYATQDEPNGLAEAFIIGEEFIKTDDVCLILGDNLFYGESFEQLVQKSIKNSEGCTVFGYYVNNPQRYGVAEIDSNNKVIQIVEKPKEPKSNYAVTGIYFYNNSVVSIAKNIKPSERGELEITDINNEYLKFNKLNLEIIPRGNAWLDTGTHDSLLEASEFVSIVEKRQGLKIACLEEIAYKKGYITLEKLKNFAEKMKKNSYGKYLHEICRREEQIK